MGPLASLSGQVFTMGRFVKYLQLGLTVIIDSDYCFPLLIDKFYVNLYSELDLVVHNPSKGLAMYMLGKWGSLE